MKNISAFEYGLEKLLTICVSELARSAPRKKNTVRENNISLMNRNLNKTYMKRNPLQYQFLQNRSSTNIGT